MRCEGREGRWKGRGGVGLKEIKNGGWKGNLAKSGVGSLRCEDMGSGGGGRRGEQKYLSCYQ